MSRGISFNPRPEQSTNVRSQWQTAGHSRGSARQSAAYLLLKSSPPVQSQKESQLKMFYGRFMFNFQLTFNFFFSQWFNLSSVHLFRCFTLGATRFYWILMQVVSQPAQVAIANKWISCQMSKLLKDEKKISCNLVTTALKPYIVCICFSASKVPLDSDCILLS